MYGHLLGPLTIRFLPRPPRIGAPIQEETCLKEAYIALC